MDAAKVIAAIEAVANPRLQAAWDKSGMQVAASRPEVGFLAVFLDPTVEAIGRAIEAGADFLLSHHPLTLKPALPGKLNAWHESLRLLLGANVFLYAAHTSLDVNANGPAGWLGRALGLKNCKPLEPTAEGGIGFGLVGDLPACEPLPLLVNKILRLARVNCGQLAGPQSNGMAGRLAYCGGSGADLAELAYNEGCGLYVTGDVKHHAALEARLPLLDVGHHSLEEEMMRVFAEDLAERLPGLRVEFFASLSPFRLACQD